jgi:asparagine synthase (glutamine-hydrolysing)
MCGIVGMHASREDREELRRLLDAMNGLQLHRGPDGSGVHVHAERCFGMAMRRLAIVDISGGSQPMVSEDGRYVLVFNGEIVNAPELRRELESSGVTFRSDHSDTEVLLRLLCSAGVAALPRLNGMFAFALYDRLAGVVTIARDRLGIKPLYYTDSGGRFAFASELKSLLALPFVEREIDAQSLFHYLSLMYVPGPATIIRGVRKLDPGSVLTYHLVTRSVSVRRWWRVSFVPDHSVPEQEWPEQIRDALARSVKRWTMSDVPVACSLSGGLDSSAIVGLLARQGGRVVTYSLGFSGAGEEAWNELPLAAEVARKWGTEHHELTLSPASLLADLGHMVWHLDEPYGGGLPSWAVFRHMSTGVKVGLTGTGGDELFGSYGKWTGLEGRWPFRRTRGADAFRRLFFERYYYFADGEKRRALLTSGVDVADTSSLLFDHYAAAGARSPRDACAATDIHTQLPDEFLAMTDRFSMAHSLEMRPPFLDNEMVDLVSRIPHGVRTSRRDLKGLLRRAVAPVLPGVLLAAPKKGFVLPLGLWLRNELRPMTEALLSPARLRRQGIFRDDVHSRVLTPFLEGRAQWTTRVWGLLMFQLWHMQFIENGKRSQPLPVDEAIAAAAA